MINYRTLEELSLHDKMIQKTKDDLYTVKIENQYIHSLYACGREAKRLIEGILPLDREKTLIIIIGSGLGYHIEMLEKAGFNRIIIIEKNPVIYNYFKKIYVLKEGMYLLSPSDKADKLDSIFSLVELAQLKNIKTVVLRGGYKKELYEDFEERIDRLLKVKLGDFTTRLKFEEIWFINIIKNIKNLKKSFLVSQLFNRARDIPIVIVSAGPSLRDSLNSLRKIKDKAIVIAVDTAILPLYEAGIAPDIVYSLDSQVYNLQDFCMIEKDYFKKINLVYDIVVNPYLPHFFESFQNDRINKFIANTAHMDFDFQGNPFLIKNELVNWMEVEGSFKIGDIETGGSVSTSAFHFAYMMGGNPLIIIGQDLAYTYMMSHSSSSSHFYKIMGNENRFLTIQSIFLNILFSRRSMLTDALYPGLSNEDKIYTDFVLNNLKGWFEESAKSVMQFQRSVRLINSTIQGAKIRFFNNMPLEGCFTDIPAIREKEKILFSCLIDFHKIDKMIMEIKRLSGYITSLKIDKNIFNNIEMSQWSFVLRYLMKEKLVFERYERLDVENIERKIYRLTKAIEGIEV